MSSSAIQLLSPLGENDTIAEFFSGKNLFITGASGFLGKALIEKLLWSCPNIGRIYILLRPKKSISIEQRLEAIKKDIVFERVRDKNPKLLENLIPINGDVRNLNLGLSQTDIQRLIENVSIVYHVAASVRFDQPLKDAILMNTRGTREVCKLVLSLRNVDAFAHISTAYCQHDKAVIEEKMYKNSNTDWERMITIAEQSEEEMGRNLDALCWKIAGNFPNTYTYTKALSESVVIDLCEGKVPTIVIRPTIVIQAYKEPFTGWIDNKNGPVALIIMAMLGLLRVIPENKRTVFSMVPADLVINTFIKSVWINRHLNPDEIQVYNCCNDKEFAMTLELMSNMNENLGIHLNFLWYPEVYFIENRFLYVLVALFLQILPAMLIDAILSFGGDKNKKNKPTPSLLKIQRKMFTALNCLHYFMANQWTVKNDNHFALDEFLNENERESFCANVVNEDPLAFNIKSAKVGAKLLLNDKMQDLDKRQKRAKIMKLAHGILKSLCFIGFCYIVFWCVLVPGPIARFSS